ncbi:MAG: glycosyltransferase [Prevotellaceae bacterium]|jgi:glycosyltransferase involved in cell wall biosynthesis|nr:glycosyltransferase [Prevotellaceae bacterium]
MLSILIPAYNYNIVKLASDLHSQAKSLGVDFEIVVIEDGSQKFLSENKSIENLSFVKYFVLKENIGRSAIRNLLADTALYDNLLFIDCDAEVASNYFLEKYLPFCNKKQITIGGTMYCSENQDGRCSLRLKYGIEREQKGTNFTTFNFLIYKDIFQQIRFDETLKTYGYEDMLFGVELIERKIPTVFIDNKLIHNGLDDNFAFLQKVDTATKNLYFLYKKNAFNVLTKTSRILSFYQKLKKLHLTKIISLKFKIFKPLIIKNLTGKNPSLLLFDFYKLGIFCAISEKKQ